MTGDQRTADTAGRQLAKRRMGCQMVVDVGSRVLMSHSDLQGGLESALMPIGMFGGAKRLLQLGTGVLQPTRARIGNRNKKRVARQKGDRPDNGDIEPCFAQQ